MNKIEIADASHIGIICVGDALGLKESSPRYAELEQEMTEICSDTIGEKLNEGDYGAMFNNPVVNNGIIEAEFTSEVYEFHLAYSDDELPKEITTNRGQAYSICASDPERDENDKVIDSEVHIESFKIYLKKYAEAVGEKVVNSQAEYAKENYEDFIGNN